MRALTAYLTTAVVFLVIDAVWLSQIAGPFFAAQLGDLMANPIRYDIAAAFYLFYVVGIVIFAVLPGLDAGSTRVALVKGALFGLFAYATYDLTNLASINGWPWIIAVVDIPWGAVVTGFSAWAGCALSLRLLGSRAARPA